MRIGRGAAHGFGRGEGARGASNRSHPSGRRNGNWSGASANPLMVRPKLGFRRHNAGLGGDQVIMLDTLVAGETNGFLAEPRRIEIAIVHQEFVVLGRRFGDEFAVRIAGRASERSPASGRCTCRTRRPACATRESRGRLARNSAFRDAGGCAWDQTHRGRADGELASGGRDPRIAVCPIMAAARE